MAMGRSAARLLLINFSVACTSRPATVCSTGSAAAFREIVPNTGALRVQALFVLSELVKEA